MFQTRCLRGSGLVWLATLIFLSLAWPGSWAYGLPADRQTIIVLGDSLGDGMYAGLHQLLRADKGVKLMRFSQVGTGLYNLDLDTWRNKMSGVIAQNRPSVAIVMLGGNDPQPMVYEGRRRFEFKSEEWRRLYSERVGEVMDYLVKNNIATFWIGLPVMRQADYDRDIQLLNEIYAACCAKHGVVYIPTRELTVDDQGRYTTYGTDANGRRWSMRINDGKHFTLTGYEYLANHVLSAIGQKVPAFRRGAGGE